MWPFKKKPDPLAAVAQRLDSIEQGQKDLKLAIQREDPDGDPVGESIKKGRRQTQPVIYFQIPGRKADPSRSYSGFDAATVPEVGPVYDLAECIRLQDIESYFAVSVDRHVELIMKDGYYLDSHNADAKTYVERRLKEISYISGQPFSDTIRELVRNTVVTSNGTIVKKRDASRSSGRRIRMFNKELDPISALYIPDPSSITVKQNRSGRPYLWISRIEDHEKTWSYTDVIHIAIRKKSGFLFGTPYVIPVLEDIRALRKLEQLSEHVAHKYAFPLMHWKVGTPDAPADMVVGPNGEQIEETRMAENYARLLAQEGFVCTSERNEILILGAEGERMDLQPFIDHMELRVFGGLRISELDIGRGDTSNRSTAKVMSQILVDACKEIQDSISQYLNHYLIDELLLEGGYDPFKIENQVRFAWPSIDKEEERAKENHALNQYVTGGITQPELRVALGRNPLTDEEQNQLFLHTWLIPLAEATAEAKAAAKPPAASKASAMKVRTQPVNQHGVLPTVPKVTANDVVMAYWDSCAANVRKAIDQSIDCRPVIYQTMQLIMDTIEVPIHESWEKTVRDATTKAGMGVPSVVPQASLKQYLTYIRTKDLRSLARTCMMSAGLDPNTGLIDHDENKSLTMIASAFEAFKPLLAMKVSRFVRGAEFLGSFDAARLTGATTIKANFEDGSQQEMAISDSGSIYLASNPKLRDVQYE